VAYATGTATNYSDLWTKLLSFLQTNSALVAAGQNWSVAWSAPGGAPNSTDTVLRGPGMSGSDSIYVGLRLVADTVGDKFTIYMTGMTGVISGATTYNGHVNCTPVAERIFLQNAPMTYWFVANGRRFIVITKNSTVYQAAYCGLFLPFSMPEDYSYPLFIGGAASETATAVTDWRSTSNAHALFPLARYNSSSGPYDPSAYMLSPSGEWLRCGAFGSSSGVNVALGPDFFGDEDFGSGDDFDNTSYGYKEAKDRFVQAYGGAWPLTPITLMQSTPADQTFGFLHGVYHVPGRGNSAENIVVKNSVNHLVVQNAFRTGIGDYFAVALE